MTDETCLNIPLVSYRGLQRSARIVEIMVKHYFPLHGLNIDDYFICHPLLSFFSALIYQTDDRAEAFQAASAPGSAVQAGREWHALTESVLSALHLCVPEVQQELAGVAAYVELETRLLHSSPIEHADLRRALELRSSDLRAMHRLILLLLNRNVDEKLFQLCYPLEVMAEIRDDLYQFDEDRASGTFNTYMLLQKLYSDDASKRLLIEREHYQQMFQQRLQSAPLHLQELMASRGLEAFDLETLPCPETP